MRAHVSADPLAAAGRGDEEKSPVHAQLLPRTPTLAETRLRSVSSPRRNDPAMPVKRSHTPRKPLMHKAGTTKAKERTLTGPRASRAERHHPGNGRRNHLGTPSEIKWRPPKTLAVLVDLWFDETGFVLGDANAGSDWVF